MTRPHRYRRYVRVVVKPNELSMTLHLWPHWGIRNQIRNHLPLPRHSTVPPPPFLHVTLLLLTLFSALSFSSPPDNSSNRARGERWHARWARIRSVLRNSACAVSIVCRRKNSRRTSTFSADSCTPTPLTLRLPLRQGRRQSNESSGSQPLRSRDQRRRRKRRKPDARRTTIARAKGASGMGRSEGGRDICLYVDVRICCWMNPCVARIDGCFPWCKYKS